jgi:predicted hydrolase (HD superfamily)
MYYLRRKRDPWRDQIAGLLHDIDAGLVRDWPDGYTAATIDAIRYTRSEQAACMNEVLS